MDKLISYSAVVLDERSRAKLLSDFEIPEGWEIISDHMTVTMGPLKDKKSLGRNFILEVVALSQDDKVMAVKIDIPPTFWTGVGEKVKPLPHITLAVNRANGGKPQMSNDLTDWMPFEPFLLRGTLEEIAR